MEQKASETLITKVPGLQFASTPDHSLSTLIIYCYFNDFLRNYSFRCTAFVWLVSPYSGPCPETVFGVMELQRTIRRSNCLFAMFCLGDVYLLYTFLRILLSYGEKESWKGSHERKCRPRFIDSNNPPHVTQ